MPRKYCLPIIKNSQKEILKTICANINEYHYFEIWIDYINDLNNEFIKEIKKLLNDRLIIVFRRQNLDTINLKLNKRLSIIEMLKKSQSLIDLDLFTQKNELNHIKSHRLEVRTIVSYHNYQMTPEDSKLKEIINTMNEYKPTVYKIATMCRNEKDALRLLQLLLEIKEKKIKYIILGMGKFGIITRIFGTLWGNEVIFAPRVSKEQSAPGQLTKDRLENILKELSD